MDLDPGVTDVQRAHRRLAAAMEALQEPASPRELARHWLDAGDVVGFARHAVTASVDAGRAEDHDEQAALLDALLAAWDRPGVAPACGARWHEVVVLSAHAHRLRGDPAAAANRGREALAHQEGAAPLDTAAALVELAAALTELADPAAAGLASEAVEVVRALPDGTEATRLLALAVGILVNYVDDGPAAEAVADASERARRWGLGDVVARSDTTLGTLLAARDPMGAAEAFDRARIVAERLVTDEPALLLRYFTNAGESLRGQGRVDAAATLAAAGLTWAVDRGFTDSSGAHLAATLVEALLDAGRFEEAAGHVAVWLPRATAGRERWWLLGLRGRLELALGELDDATQTLAGILDETDAASLPASPAQAVAQLWCELAAHSVGGTDAVDRALETAEASTPGAPFTALALLALAARALGPDSGGARARRLDDAWAVLLPNVHPSIAEPWQALGTAFRSPGGTTASATAWDAALAASRRRLPFSWRVEAALAAARDALASGRVARARHLVAVARDLVDASGARLWDAELVLAEQRLLPQAVPEWERLSPREAEVLGLLATGATNEVAADVLGISPRTVEVHVGHVLRKLGATSRGGAVAAAVRRGLLGEDDLRIR